jgi:iron complex transport system substrate-binding protein
MAAGQGTKAQALMDMLNVQNAFSHQGYKPVSAEGALMAAPEIVLVGHTGPADTDSVKQTLAMTPASNNNQIHAVDVGLALGFGPRIAEALAMLKPLVYSHTDMSQVAVE